MESLFIIILSICIFRIGSNEESCHSFQPKAISECISKETGQSHFGCCGLNVINEPICVPFGNTKASRDVLEKMSEVFKEQHVSFDYQCPNKDDEIKGTCEEFLGVFVNDKNQCLKLTTPLKNTTCCGIKGKFAYNDYGVKFEIPQTICVPLSINKAEQEAFINEMIKRSEGRMKFEEYTCGYDNYFKNLFLIAYIFAMLILI